MLVLIILNVSHYYYYILCAQLEKASVGLDFLCIHAKLKGFFYIPDLGSGDPAVLRPQGIKKANGLLSVGQECLLLQRVPLPLIEYKMMGPRTSRRFVSMHYCAAHPTPLQLTIGDQTLYLYLCFTLCENITEVPFFVFMHV